MTAALDMKFMLRKIVAPVESVTCLRIYFRGWNFAWNTKAENTYSDIKLFRQIYLIDVDMKPGCSLAQHWNKIHAS